MDTKVKKQVTENVYAVLVREDQFCELGLDQRGKLIQGMINDAEVYADSYVIGNAVSIETELALFNSHVAFLVNDFIR